MEQTIRPFAVYGGAAQLWHARDEEILFDGPAGTGKTVPMLMRARWLGEMYPGARIILCRKTRASMTESVLPAWEQEILSDQDMLEVGRVSMAHRQSYTFANGTHYVITGLEDVGRIMSAQYNVIKVFEATELTVADWELLTSRLRAPGMPFTQIVADCNPGADTHWLIRRHRAGKMRRIQSFHHDNPRWFRHDLDPVTGKWDGVSGEWTDEGVRYLHRLNRMSGARRIRLLKGDWVAEEGQVYPEFQTGIHVIDHPRDEKGEKTLEPLNLRWFFASGDWGHRSPGCLHVWGVDNRDRMFLVREVYRVGKQQDWWAEKLCELDREFGLSRCVYDPSEDALIELFNRMLGHLRGRDTGRIVEGAENAIKTGISLVKFALSGTHPEDVASGIPPAGEPMLFLLRDTLESRDPILAENYEPCCLVDELPSLVWRKGSDGRELKREEPDPDCVDHACDSLRYACVFKFGKRLGKKKTRTPLQPGSIGWMLGKRYAED